MNTSFLIKIGATLLIFITMISCQTLTESEAKTILKKYYNNVDFVYNNDKSHVIEIYFSNSDVDKIPNEIKAFKFLKKIEFEKTKLKELNFKNIVNDELESIVIYESPLKQIPSNINKFKRLKRLIFQGTDVDTISNDIFKLKNLEILNFSNTKVKGIPNEIFKLNKLTHLYVNTNNDIPSQIMDLKNLIAFGGSFNSFNNFKYLSGLKYLSFNDCLSKDIPEDIGSFDSLTILDFVNCNIRSFPDQLFRNIPEQQLYLNLHGCDSLK
ncbi:leucine-rich repeat domain-containing protein, partial [Flammeovirga pacifica]|uniref:leucine-rich repeat domain-containing protein n=1 Tax=Flammeovirga pacifica TaxID=915059 RepID=UPI001114CDF1